MESCQLDRETLTTLKAQGFGDGSIGRDYGLTHYEIKKLRNLWSIEACSVNASSSQVLKYLKTAPSDVSNPIMAAEMGITLVEISRILTYLERRGVIVRDMDHDTPGRSRRRIVIASDAAGKIATRPDRWGRGNLTHKEIKRLYGIRLYGTEPTAPSNVPEILESSDLYRFFTGREKPGR